MSISAVSRRTLVKASAATMAGLSVLRFAGPARAFQTPEGGVVIPWNDQPEANPVPEVIVRQLDWESLDSWITPNDQFFVIKHYDEPTIDLSSWALQISGDVANPLTLSLDGLKARDRAEVTFTLECSGNTGLPFFDGGIGNAVWAGTPLAPILEEAGISDSAREIVSWGADSGEQTRGDSKITEYFARSLSIEDAMNPANIIAYEMNGEPLPPLHGAPARLILPGWYGVNNVKWLTRIEAIDRRFQGFFMALDYVSIYQEAQGDEMVWTFTTVGRDRLKSAPARVLDRDGDYLVQGAAWGSEIAKVEVSVDSGGWQPAELTTDGSDPLTWTFWTFDLGSLAPGEHTVASRAIAVSGAQQPAPDDSRLATKTTYFESNGIITRRFTAA
jgi:DMSO/TMAO reductase YedYZ molybdopterin-dependent catalytic subunit